MESLHKPGRTTGDRSRGPTDKDKDHGIYLCQSELKTNAKC